MKRKLISLLCMFLATLIWGVAFVPQSIGMEHIGPFTFQAVRCALAVIGLLPVIALTDRMQHRKGTYLSLWKDKKLWSAGLLCGIPLFLACNLQQIGLSEGTDPGISGFLTAMYIVMVPVLSIFLKKKPTIMVPISVAIAVAGLYFLSFAGVPKIALGDLLTLLCAMMFAVQIIMVDRFAADVDPLRLNTIQALIGSVLAFAVMLFTEQPSWNSILACAGPLAYTGFLSMGAAYTLQIISQKGLKPTTASLFMSLEAVFAVIASCLYYRKWLTGNELLGCALMFIAVLLSQLPIPNKKSG